MTIPLRLAASGVASLLTFGGFAADLSLAPDLSFTDETVGAGARCASGAENF